MKIIIPLIFASLFCGWLPAQNEKSAKVTVFKPGTEATKSEDPAPTVTLMNVIKWNNYLLLRGVFMINYERKLNDNISVEAGLGLTYRDWIFESTKLGQDLDLFASNFNKPIIKLATEFGLRYYPNGHDNFEGFYLSPMVSYRGYGFETQGLNSGTYPLPGATNNKPGYTFVDLQAKIGYQFESFFSWDILRDFYVGVGYRNAFVKQYVETTTSTSQGNLTTANFTKSQMHFPQILAGLKICFPY